MTWLPLAIEGALAISLLLPQRLRWRTMGAGLVFHLSIALMMGLWSFALAMAGGILLLRLPLGSTIQFLITKPAVPTLPTPGQGAEPVHAGEQARAAARLRRG
ncbi:hypothetical protein ACWC98_33305 [Streptomyces goshikiensis]